MTQWQDAPGDAGAWQPLISGPERAAVLGVVGELAEALMSEYPIKPTPVSSRGYSLGSGYIGHALLLAYAGESCDVAAWRHGADTIISTALLDLRETRQTPSLFGHALGVGWVSAHLARCFDWFEAVDLDDLDQELCEFLLNLKAPVNFDLISGLVGIGVYGLERMPNATAGEIVRLVVEALDRCAVANDGEIAWLSLAPRSDPELCARYPDGYFNLGVAHGVPGIIGFLARVVEAQAASERSGELLRRSVAWLLQHRLDESAVSVFTSKADSRHANLPSRLAWCYGDPGIVPQLLVSAKALRDPSLHAFAVSVGLKALARAERDHAVIDPALCHGSSGLLHIFNRLWRYTGDERFRTLAVHWLHDTMARRTFGRGMEGFAFVTPEPPVGARYEKRSERQSGFLEGISGIALALLAATSSLAPNWDRVLLSDLPPRR